MLGAKDPWGVCLDVGGDDAEVECTPPAFAFAGVIAGATLSTLPTKPSLATVGLRLRHESAFVVVESDLLDGCALDIQQPRP
jgi:hypothetical protein